ncbi:YtxH domain-containing protein [Oscillochloris sp. ZM17-4]|uniref:YtxH domain-containing protein n=1 Tax=Oscillochloris sp. ZM17-4 TaxID=2866714 RepID=UPI001C736A6F|nr:YtxH domain-containing protein [Oscillochloris sp. ZM17-4]
MSDIDQAIAEIIPGRRDQSMLSGMLLGALAGAAAAALLAPRSGAATRELLRERGLELKDRAEEMLRSRRSPL